MEIKTILRMRSFILFLKIALIFSRGCDSLAMCNKDDLFVRSSLQQEVSAPGLLLHGFKNKQAVPLAGLPLPLQKAGKEHSVQASTHNHSRGQA